LPLPVSEQVNRMSRAKRLVAFASRARRCLKTNRDFARKQFGALRWHVRLSALNATLESVLRDPDAFLGHARSLKAGRSSTVGAANLLVVKRFNFRRWLRPFKDLFRQSRARAAFVKAYHLELCGVLTARVFAAADERVLGLVRRGFVVMEEIPGAVVLPNWAGDERIAARRVGALIAKLHNEGFAHRDLKETNIVFSANGQPYLIDLEGLRFVGVLRMETAMANCARLAEGVGTAGKLNRSTFFAFMCAYIRARKRADRNGP
jgi:tRNA A-37 threonylcarbamoyl transferase component Bud32